jgi:aconitate hydratase
VVAYAIAGSVNVDLVNEPIGDDLTGDPVYLKDIWPSKKEIEEAIASSLDSEMFRSDYAHVFEGDVLGIFGDTLTTDHISPAGAIPEDSPACQYLTGYGINPKDFNSYGSRRGNHEVLLRGTFGNIRIRNLMVDREGGWTLHMPDAELMSIYDAAIKYQEEKVPLVVIGGKEYGAGSSRDWAAKGTLLLGVRAVIAQSYERIHRSNLVGMGVLPLEFRPGETGHRWDRGD